MKVAVLVEVPPPVVVTVTLTGPLPEGEVAEHKIVDEQLTAVPAVPPKLAVVAPGTKPVPAMATTVLPTSGPADGVSEVIVGIAS